MRHCHFSEKLTAGEMAHETLSNRGCGKQGFAYGILQSKGFLREELTVSMPNCK